MSTSRRLLARAAFVSAFASVAVVVLFAGLHTLTLLIEAVGTAVIMIAALYWFLTTRGVVRWFALGLAVVVPPAFVGLLIHAGLLWVALTSIALAIVAGVTGRAALRPSAATLVSERNAPPPERAFLVMNPHSGGGKVGRFDLKKKAEALGAEVVVLDGPGIVDVAALARDAVERGADLLGVAGGDGTQALVAGIAAEHDLPFLVISAGTRNHFAMDLGLDRNDPSTCLDALVDGIEIRVDLGSINGRTFVNNASFGAYAQVVQSPAYRDDKTGTVLRMLPDLLGGPDGPGLRVRSGNLTIENPDAVLVSNGPYEMHDLAGLGRRAHLDSGVLGVVTVTVGTTREAVGLLRRTHRQGLTQDTTAEVRIDSDRPEIPAGVDGEALMLSTPVLCTITPGALRVRVPRKRPGIRRPPTHLDWVRLRQLASFRRRKTAR